MDMRNVIVASAAVAAAVLYIARGRPRPKTAPSVLVGSKTALKLSAVKAALSADVVEGVSVPSGVNDQPVGVEMTVSGARNRMAAALHSGAFKKGDFHFVVAIENGMVRMEGSEEGADERWVDLAVVIVYDCQSGLDAVATSVGVEFPPADVFEWAEGGSEGTVGALIAKRSGCDPQDPHAHLTAGLYRRTRLLEAPIRVAASSLVQRRSHSTE